MNESLKNELQRAILQKKLILFVGAGVSATLGLPDWNQLIAHMAGELEYDWRLFKQYGDSLTLAEYYLLEKGSIRDLSRWMSENWNIDKEKVKRSKIYEAIVKLNLPLIYTTNFDQCLKIAFDAWGKKSKEIVDVEDFLENDEETIQIVKFHGDMERESSIVLSESSYFERLNFESPMDIKLRADMLGKSVLFIGYSLSDINIRLLIYKLDQLWKRSSIAHQRPQSYIFLSKPNPVQEKIFESRGIKAIVGKGLDKTQSMELFLKQLAGI